FSCYLNPIRLARRMESSSFLYLFYFTVIFLIIMRLKETVGYERLRDETELLSLIQKYDTQDAVGSFRSLRIHQKLCENEKNCEIIPPFRTYYPAYSIAGPGHRVSSCMIPKNMSTVLSAIFCALFTHSLRNSSRPVTKMGREICNQRNELHNYKQIKNIAHGQPWVNFVMVREPAERFLSGFMYMCSPGNGENSVCEGCAGDIKCALRRTLESSRRFAAGDLTASSYLLWHLGPQNWHCDFQRNLEHFKLIHYSPENKEKLNSDLSKVLEEGKVDRSDVELIASQVSSGTSIHATRQKAETKMFEKHMEDIEVKRLLVKIFYWDYVLFNFTLPDVDF
ncbi:hypothetical protein V3C99_008084, partial [Haemonchus contortus]